MARKLTQRIKELSKKDSIKAAKELIKERKRLSSKDLIPGNLIFGYYSAKDKTQTYDKTPLMLILRRNKTHTLAINFHWIPLSMRLNLIRSIIMMNEKEIKRGSPLTFSYQKLRPMLKSLGYAPCIRLYINKRMSNNGVVIPPERLTEVARLKTETFTNGKYSAAQMFQMAKRRKRR